MPLVSEPLGGSDAGMPEDIFCELYRELAKALRKPMDSAAAALLLEDTIALRGVFEDAAQRARPDLVLELVKEALTQSGAEEAGPAERRRTLAEAALSGLLGQPGAPLLDAQLKNHAHDVVRVETAWDRAVERTINDTQASREAFENTSAEDLVGERALVGFFESVYLTLAEFETGGDDTFTNRYFNLLAAFIEKFSLRYDLRRPCILCPTLPGVFASLVRDLRALTAEDSHLDALMKDFENAVRDLRQDCSDGRIKTCLQKQVNLLEALGGTYPGVTEAELGRMCGQINSWPHGAVKAALKNLYGFASDYPGIRHGGTPASALRAVDMRDMVALSILLAGFTPYLSNGLNFDVVYRGA